MRTPRLSTRPAYMETFSEPGNETPGKSQMECVRLFPASGVKSAARTMHSGPVSVGSAVEVFVKNVVVKNAAGELSKTLGDAEDALRQIEAEVFHLSISSERGVYDEPRVALGAILQELHDILLVVLEAAELPETRTSLLKSWSDFTSNDLRKTIDDGQYENCTSPALDFLARIIHGIRISSTEGISSEEAWTLNRLEEILRDAAALHHRKNRAQKKAGDLQKVMHDYLQACFPDFRK